MMRKEKLWLASIGWITFVLILADIYMMFIYAPTEKFLGDVQRLMYPHVASAMMSYLGFGLGLVGSIFYLASKNRRWDRLAVSSVEVGVLFTLVVLTTGPVWARPVWNTWWTWDPRLVSSLILFFIYVAYLLLHASVPGERGRRIAAVFAIIGFIDIPVVHFSVQWWRSIHPNVIQQDKANMPPEMLTTLSFSMLAFLALFIYLLMLRMNLAAGQHRLSVLQEKFRSDKLQAW
jgi:heme exporter protein C